MKLQWLENSSRAVKLVRNVTQRVFVAITLVVLVACSSPEDKLAEYLSSAAALFDDGNYDKASVQYRNALQIDERNIEAWYGLARVSRAQGSVKAAYDHHVIVTELDETHVAAQLFVGRALLVGKQLDRALEKSELLLELAPDNADVHAFRAAVLYQLADVKGALAEANLALEKDPRNIHALLLLAGERLAAEDAKAAIVYLDRGLAAEEKNTALNLVKISALNQLKDVDAAIAAFEKLIVYYPDDRTLRYSLARYLVVNGRNDAAEKVFADVVANEPDAIEPKLTMVRFLLQTRGLEAALAQLDAYTQQNPKAFELRFGQAELYTAAKQVKKAKSVYQAIMAEAGDEPDGLKARNRLAQLALAAKDEAGAEKLIREVLAADENNVQALILRARMLAQKEKYDEAITDLRTALSEEPGSAQASVLLARVHLKLGQTSLAHDRYVRAIDANPKQSSIALEYARLLIQARSFQEADQVLDDLLARSPNLVAAMEMQAQVKLSLQQWAEAEALANKIKETGGKEAAASQILGLALQGQKEYEESISAFTQAHESAPNAAQPMVALVRSYVASGKTQEAKDFLEAVVRTNQDNYAAQFLLGRLYMAEKDFDKAAAAFAKAVAVNPKLGVGHYALSTAYQSQGDQIKAVEALQAGVEAVPDNAALKIALAGIYEKDGDYEAAIPLYERVLERSPNQPVVRNNLASILVDFKGDPESLSRALELATPLAEAKVPHFRDTLGWVYHKSGDNDRALAILEGVVRDQPELGVFQYHLGMTYRALGDRGKAKEALEKAVALGEKSPYTGLDEAKSALQTL